jgi:GNAT superfamily N-acetyltransferase
VTEPVFPDGAGARAYPAHAEALYEALKPDPYFAALESWAATASPREAMLDYYDLSLREAAAYGRLYLPEADAYGVSLWLTPVSPERAREKKARRERFLLHRFGERALGRYQDVMKRMSANAEPLVDADAWYLSIVGVLPAYQNQGLGGFLILPVLEESDRAGVMTFLETFTPRNMTFYGRLGFQEAGAFHEPLSGATYRLMVRPPS